jgi:hypothetical protein
MATIRTPNIIKRNTVSDPENLGAKSGPANTAGSRGGGAGGRTTRTVTPAKRISSGKRMTSKKTYQAINDKAAMHGIGALSKKQVKKTSQREDGMVSYSGPYAKNKTDKRIDAKLQKAGSKLSPKQGRKISKTSRLNGN